jgi:hypothetical protein
MGLCGLMSGGGIFVGLFHILFDLLMCGY